MKYCPSCKKTLSVDCFYKSSQGKSGYRDRCKNCWKNDFNDKNNTRNNLKNTARRNAITNPAISARHQGIKWIPQVIAFLLWKFQNNHCAICNVEQKEKKLHRDHNHVTNWLRGLLCANCNLRLPTKYCDGTLEKAREYLESQNCYTKEYIDKCIDYLENPPYFKLMEFHKIERPNDGETFEDYKIRKPLLFVPTPL